MMKTREQWATEVLNEVSFYTQARIGSALIGYEKGFESVPKSVFDQIDDAGKRLRALLLEVPDPVGWKLVRVEATSGMLTKGVMKLLGCASSELDDHPFQTMIGYKHEVDDIFKAMLAASPEYKDES